MKGWAVIYKGLSFLFSVIKALRISFGHMGYLGYKQTHKRLRPMAVLNDLKQII